MKTLVSMIFLAILALGCGSSKTYEYEFNGCSTGRHTFSSDEEYCNGLKSSSKNNGCAVGMRKDAFEKECTGAFVETD